MSNDIEILICFRNPSRYSPARCGRFIAAENFPGLHVLDGRAMPLEEYESLPENFLSTLQTGGQSLQVRVLRPIPVAVALNNVRDNGGRDSEPTLTTEQALADARNKQQVIDLAAKHGLTLDPKMTRREMEDALLAHLTPEEEGEGEGDEPVQIDAPEEASPEIDPTDPTDRPDPTDPSPAEPPADDIWGEV